MNATLYATVTYDTDYQFNSSEQRVIGARLDKAIHRGSLSGSVAYVSSTDNLTGNVPATSSKYIQLTAQAHYELTPLTNADFALTGAHYQQGNGYHGNNPLWLQFSAGISHQLPYNMMAGLQYIFTTYRGGADAINVNRVFVSLSYNFFAAAGG